MRNDNIGPESRAAAPVSLDKLLRDIVRTELDQVVRQYLEPQLRALRERVAELAADESRRAEEFVCVDRAARVAGVRPRTIREWMKYGHLSRYRSGRLLRVKLSELYEFLARETDAPAVAAIDAEEYADQFLQETMG